MLSPKTRTNLKNAKSYFEEHLSDYAEYQRVQGEWIGEGTASLAYLAKSLCINSWRSARTSIRRGVSS